MQRYTWRTLVMVVALCSLTHTGWATSTQPASRPSSHPSTKPTSKPSSRPSTKPTSRPVNRPTSRPSSKPATTRTTSPKQYGWLSIALTPLAKAWIDGKPLGVAPVSYLRMAAGIHRVRIEHKQYPTSTFHLNVKADRHLSLGRQKNKKLGIYFVRGEQSQVRIVSYPASPKQGKLRFLSLSPGRYCVGAKAASCFFLTPGEQLYIQAKGSTYLLPSRKAKTNARSYAKRPGFGLLTLYSYPPGALFLNNKLLTMTPVAQLPVPPGTYKVWIRNGYLQMEHRFSLQIKAGQELRKVVYLRPYSPAGANLLLTSKEPVEVFVDGLYKGWTPARVIPIAAGQHKVTFRFPKGTSKTLSIKAAPGQLLPLSP